MVRKTTLLQVVMQTIGSVTLFQLIVTMLLLVHGEIVIMVHGLAQSIRLNLMGTVG